jgi:hypothetical protein
VCASRKLVASGRPEMHFTRDKPSVFDFPRPKKKPFASSRVEMWDETATHVVIFEERHGCDRRSPHNSSWTG